MRKIGLALAAVFVAGGLVGGVLGRTTAASAYAESTEHRDACVGQDGYAGSSVHFDYVFFCTSDGIFHSLVRTSIAR